MILTVDIGNSRIKLAQWQAGVIVARKASSPADVSVIATLDALFSGVDKPSRIFAVCVADEKKRQALIDWVARHWQLTVEFMKTEKRYRNIINAYENPEQHGADRWAAVVAAHELFSASPVCVIGAGTATTFDFVNEKGVHLGGYILPSYVTMHRALLGDTANVITNLSANSSADLNMPFIDNEKIPDNTNDAVNDGLHKLLQAGVREFCSSAKQVLGESVKIIITGGFAQTILSYPKMPEMHHQPDLVMQGLYNIMMQSQDQTES